MLNYQRVISATLKKKTHTTKNRVGCKKNLHSQRTMSPYLYVSQDPSGLVGHFFGLDIVDTVDAVDAASDRSIFRGRSGSWAGGKPVG